MKKIAHAYIFEFDRKLLNDLYIIFIMKFFSRNVLKNLSIFLGVVLKFCLVLHSRIYERNITKDNGTFQTPQFFPQLSSKIRSKLLMRFEKKKKLDNTLRHATQNITYTKINCRVKLGDHKKLVTLYMSYMFHIHIHNDICEYIYNRLWSRGREVFLWSEIQPPGIRTLYQ